MKKIISLLVLFILVVTPALRAEESLRDKAKARRLTPEERALFGPKCSDLRYDPRMIRAAEEARQRARGRNG